MKQPLLSRLQQSDNHLRLTIVCGKLIHDAGGSVTIEGPPDCRDPASAWFLSLGGYDSSNQHPVWQDQTMLDYLAYTESELVTRPMCAAGSPYRAFRTIAMNKKAIAGSVEYRALACTHRQHLQMKGRDANGVWHGEHAERYTKKWCSILDRIHELAWADQEEPGAASSSSSSSSSGGGEGSSEGDGSSSDSHSRDSDSGGSGSSEGSTTDSDEAVSQGQPQKRQRQALQQQPQVGSETAAGSALSGQASLARPRASHESSKIVVRHH